MRNISYTFICIILFIEYVNIHKTIYIAISVILQ